MTAYDPYFTDLVRDLDGSFGRRVRLRRENRGMSQQQLADAMHKYGFTWHQTTVGKTEAGERPIKLAEALAVAITLGYGANLDELIHEDASRALRLERLTAAQNEVMGLFDWILDRSEKINKEIDETEAKVAAQEGSDGEHRPQA